ncbi:MAG TPA: hypothetical protein VH834_09470 [Solirubrobacteraceae bacterium]|jgi:hypothetical protein
MADHTHTNGNGPALAAPVRNRYFYGKLLDAPHLQMEQSYFLERRRLLNRLALGFGVLCGLDVRSAGDGGVVVEPGVAIDGRGREILVGAPFVVADPFALTDACGAPTGESSDGGPVILCLAYHECDVDPVPVLVADCDVQERCVPGAVRERFRLLIRSPDDDDVRLPGGLTMEQCGAIFHAGDTATRELLCQLLSGPCAEGAGCCVPIARVTRQDDTVTVDPCVARTTIYSNAALLDLILCLAARVEECCRDRPPVTRPPVVRALFPKPAASTTFTELRLTLGTDTGVLAVTFDRTIADARLQSPDPWLRAWALLGPNAAGEVAVERIPLLLDRPAFDGAFAGSEGSTAIYRAGPGGGAQPVNVLAAIREALANGAGARLLVQIRAEDAGTGPVDESTPAELLDAEFTATGLDMGTLDKIWNTTSSTVRDIWDHIPVPPGAPPDSLPSGEGHEGGRLHSYFEVTA